MYQKLQQNDQVSSVFVSNQVLRSHQSRAILENGSYFLICFFQIQTTCCQVSTVTFPDRTQVQNFAIFPDQLIFRVDCQAVQITKVPNGDFVAILLLINPSLDHIPDTNFQPLITKIIAPIVNNLHLAAPNNIVHHLLEDLKFMNYQTAYLTWISFF